MSETAGLQAALPYLVGTFIFGYLLGSIPFGFLFTRAAGLGDVRKIGSGNIGATNVLRTGRKSLAAATLLCDGLKGAVALLIAGYALGPECAMAAGFGAFIGHLFPVWLGFRGGKGVATYAGILLGIGLYSGAWYGLLAFAIVWLGVAFLTRYSSLAALLASIAVPVVLYLTGAPLSAGLTVMMSLIVFIKHRTNIARLAAGTESRIGAKEGAKG